MLLALVTLVLAETAPPVEMTTASRTSGPSPLGVFFDATGEASGVARPPLKNGRPDFAAYHYEWHFGDDAGATWSSTGVSRNAGTGFIGAHVFEKPGTYTVTLRVTDERHQLRAYVEKITVYDGDSFYANSSAETTENTFYVSSAGADTNDGSFHRPFQTWNHGLDRLFASGGKKRLLCRRGDTFTSAGFRAKSFTGPLAIGAYGEGEPPVILAENHNTILMLGPGEGLTITGLTFRSSYDPVSGRGHHGDVIQMLDSNRHITIYDNTFSNAGLILHLAQMGALADSVIAGNTLTSWQNYGVLSGHWQRVALVGNSIRQHPDARTGDSKNPSPPEPDLPDHGPIRLRTTDRVIVSGNDLFSNTGWSPGRGGEKAHQPCLRLGSGGRADLTIVSDNVMQGGLTVAGAGPSKATEPPRTGNIWEKNWLIAPKATVRFLDTEFAGAVIRNNVFLRPDTGGTMISVIRFATPRTPSNSEQALTSLIHNNTYVSAEASGRDRSTFVVIEPDASGSFSVVNNLMDSPTVGKYGAFLGGTTAPDLRRVTSDHNLFFGTGGNFVRYGKRGISLDSWRAESGNDRHSVERDPRLTHRLDRAINLASREDGAPETSPAIDRGAPLPTVRTDVSGRSRPAGKAWDLGAVEYVPGGKKKTTSSGR